MLLSQQTTHWNWKENEKLDTYLDFARELETKLWNFDTNGSWGPSNSPQETRKENKETGNYTTNWNHLDHSTTNID